MKGARPCYPPIVLLHPIPSKCSSSRRNSARRRSGIGTRRHCLQGPCRIDPFGSGPKAGICGATADTFVARGLGRAIAAGTASHSGHAKHLAHTLKKLAEGKAPDYHIKEPAKLRAI